jgi:heavy metal sensor kinase
MSVEHEEDFLEVFRRIFSLSVSAMILFAALIGWFMSRSALKGVEEVTQTAIRIKSGSLKERVPLKSRGLEVETLAHTFNEMLDHIETLIVEMRTLTDNLAHDMRNPLTSLRGKAELALISGKGREELKSITAFTVEECDRLLQMINSMLDLAEADSGALKLTCEEIELADLAGDGVEIFETLAEERDISIVSEIPAGLRIEADRQGLQRIVANLLDNAVKYSSPGGKVVLSAQNREEMVEVRVTDEGMGIAPEEVEKIFTRFYRSDTSRSARGVGLGLSLARAIARAHSGDVTVESEPGKGSVFILSLPRLSRSAGVRRGRFSHLKVPAHKNFLFP